MASSGRPVVQFRWNMGSPLPSTPCRPPCLVLPINTACLSLWTAWLMDLIETMPSPRASVLLPLTPTSPPGSLPVVFAREVKAGSGMPGRSVADGAKGLVEPGRSGDLGRLCTAGPLEGSTWLAWGISPILGQREGSEQPGIYPGPHLGHPSIPKEAEQLGKSGEETGELPKEDHSG